MRDGEEKNPIKGTHQFNKVTLDHPVKEGKFSSLLRLKDAAGSCEGLYHFPQGEGAVNVLGRAVKLLRQMKILRGNSYSPHDVRLSSGSICASGCICSSRVGVAVAAAGLLLPR